MSPRGTVTNLALRSEAILTSPWVGTNVTAPSSGTFSNGVPKQTLTDNGTPGLHYVAQTDSSRIGGVFIISCFAKKVAGSGIIALQYGAGITYFNLNTGAWGTTNTAALTSSIEDFGGGLYRISIRSLCTGANPVIDILLCSADASPNYTGPSQQVDVGGVMMEAPAPGQTTPSPYVASGATAGVGRREYRQNLLRYSDDLTQWLVQNGTASVTAGTITGGSSNLLLRQLAPTGFGTLPGVVFRYELDVMADAACTVPITLADATDGTPTLQSNLPVTTSWVRWSLSMTTASPNAGAIGVYVGDGATWPAGRVVSVRRVSLVQATSAPDFIGTNGASANSSGAPRSKSA